MGALFQDGFFFECEECGERTYSGELTHDPMDYGMICNDCFQEKEKEVTYEE